MRNSPGTIQSFDVVNRVHALLAADTRLGLRAPLTLGFAEGVLTLDGEAEDIASKKRVLEDAASVPEVRSVVDRLCVTASTRMQDGEIRDHVRDAIVAEAELSECNLVMERVGTDEIARQPIDARGSIRVGVSRGVVRLDGDVPSLTHRRLAGVLAWWVPGTRDVQNLLGVVPPEADNDDEITDAIRLVLEREPLVDAAQIGVRTRDGRVTLTGAVTSGEQAKIAERDAWYVQGVDEVVNGIVVVR
jgi:osmotically-inducible protein OsmY